MVSFRKSLGVGVPVEVFLRVDFAGCFFFPVDLPLLLVPFLLSDVVFLSDVVVLSVLLAVSEMVSESMVMAG